MLDILHLDERKLVHITPSRLKPHSDNPLTHSKDEAKKIAASIRRFGFRNPVMIDENYNVIAGQAGCSQRSSSSLLPSRRFCSRT